MPTFFMVAAGLAHAASMAAPWSGEPVAWLQLLAMAVLVAQLALATTPRQAAWLGWVFSTTWLCGTFWWLYISMHTYGGLNALLTVVAIVALAGVLSGYYALACYFFRRFVHVSTPLSAMLFASLWTMAEMARGTWFTGFGWGAAAYAHLSGLAVFAKYIGAYGVGALAAFIACSVALWLLALRPRPMGGPGWVGPAWQSVREARSWRSIAPVLLIGGLAAVADAEFSAPGAALQVVLLQGNIKQSEKFEPSTGIADALRWYRQETHAAVATALPVAPSANPASNPAVNPTTNAAPLPLLVVAPETAIPLLPQQLPDGYWQEFAQPFQAGAAAPSGAARLVGQAALLIGIPLGSYQAGYTNSVLGVSNEPGSAAAGAAGPLAPYHYAKHHLVPFGEFIPPWFKWFTELMNIPLGDFNRGAVGQASFSFAGQRLAPNICYEDLFGEELAARFANPASAPTVFVNLSNIGWFGNTLAIDQHRAISRMRAMEFERSFIRATNTGDTVVIDHTGQVVQALPRHTRGVLTAVVQGRGGSAQKGAGITPFAGWAGHYGLWPVWIFCLVILFFTIYLYKKTK